MKDITDPRWIKCKGLLFLALGLASSQLLVLEQPTVKVGLLLALAVWCFCRAYYFAFYVIEHYVPCLSLLRAVVLLRLPLVATAPAEVAA
jgi:hypothetical protein